jgi:cyclophilin family peptidyl-prolyl cis-trans isomerase
MKRLLLALVGAGLLLAAACSDKPEEKNPVVVMETSMGTIKIELDAARAPVTVKNFLDYVDARFYDGTIFHRVIPTFMIQGGGLEPGVNKVKTVEEFKAREKKTRGAIKNEASNGLSNVRGTIAMARTGNPDSATAQFFINVADNSRKLDPQPGSPNPSTRAGYCVFGKVIEGMDVADRIKRVDTGAILDGQIEDVPEQDVLIKSVRRAEK